MNPRGCLLSALIAGFLALSPACGDDEEDKGDSDEELEGDCKTISDACHHADDGDGSEASDCHVLAHENDTTACSEQLDACETACAEHAEGH